MTLRALAGGVRAFPGMMSPAKARSLSRAWSATEPKPQAAAFSRVRRLRWRVLDKDELLGRHQRVRQVGPCFRVGFVAEELAGRRRFRRLRIAGEGGAVEEGDTRGGLR